MVVHFIASVLFAVHIGVTRSAEQNQIVEVKGHAWIADVVRRDVYLVVNRVAVLYDPVLITAFTKTAHGLYIGLAAVLPRFRIIEPLNPRQANLPCDNTKRQPLPTVFCAFFTLTLYHILRSKNL